MLMAAAVKYTYCVHGAGRVATGPKGGRQYKQYKKEKDTQSTIVIVFDVNCCVPKSQYWLRPYRPEHTSRLLRLLAPVSTCESHEWERRGKQEAKGRP